MTSSGNAETLRAIKNEHNFRGEEEKTPVITTACPETWTVELMVKQDKYYGCHPKERARHPSRRAAFRQCCYRLLLG